VRGSSAASLLGCRFGLRPNFSSIDWPDENVVRLMWHVSLHKNGEKVTLLNVPYRRVMNARFDNDLAPVRGFARVTKSHYLTRCKPMRGLLALRAACECICKRVPACVYVHAKGS